jgi:hypothetical protein
MGWGSGGGEGGRGAKGGMEADRVDSVGHRKTVGSGRL